MPDDRRPVGRARWPELLSRDGRATWRSTPRLVAMCVAMVFGLLASSGVAHELPSFPRIEVVAARPDPFRPSSWNYTVRVLDPGGRTPVSDADVRVSGFERRRGSGARLGNFWLASTPAPGIYQGTVEFPENGTWELTIAVKGRFVGETHVQAVVGVPTEVGSPLERPDLEIDWILVRHLLLEWRHLAGFGLWLGATAMGLLARRSSLRWTVGLTWLALMLDATTGLYKLEAGTPFPQGLKLGSLDGPSIFFGREYVGTLFIKHVLTLAAVGVTTVLTWRAWRHPTGDGTSRALLVTNLALVLVIAACVSVLSLLHAIVLHFS